MESAAVEAIMSHIQEREAERGHAVSFTRTEMPGNVTVMCVSCHEQTGAEKKQRVDPEDSIVNLTPHDCKLYAEDGKTVIKTFKRRPSVPTPRVQTTQSVCGRLESYDGIVIPLATPQRVTGVDPLPPCGQLAEVVITSGFYAEEYMKRQPPRRPTLVSPDTSPESVVRSPEGQILGVKRWVVHAVDP